MNKQRCNFDHRGSGPQCINTTEPDRAMCEGPHLFKCAGEHCPGLPWPASVSAHPCQCAEKSPAVPPGARVKGPTPAQLTALRLAARDATGIRYYRGGWYSITAEAGADQRDHHFAHLAASRSTYERNTDPAIAVGGVVHVGAVGGDPSAAQNTIRACVSRGWLDDSGSSNPPNIYARRWTLTGAGRAALDAAGKDAAK